MKRKQFALAAAALLAATTCAAPVWAATPRGEHGRHDFHHRHIIRVLPHGYRHVWVGHRDYFFHGRRFYVRRPGGFVLVRAPFGAIVARLPVGYLTVHIGGIRYFTFGGLYYRPVPAGYEIVEVPVPASQPVATATGNVIVQVQTLNVRSGPGQSFSIVGQVNMGTSLPVHGNAPGWYYVQLPDGQYGWVMTQFAAPFVNGASG